MGSVNDYLRGHDIQAVSDEMRSIISEFPEDFNIELEDNFCHTGGVKHEYRIELDGTEIFSKIFIYRTPIDAEELLEGYDSISDESYKDALEQRNPDGGTRILYFVPEGKPHRPEKYDQDTLELLDRFNEELEFLAMSDGKDNFGGTYMHVFDLDN